MKTKLEYVKNMIEPSKDLINKEFYFSEDFKINLLFLKNMSDIELINKLIIKPLINAKSDEKLIKKFEEIKSKTGGNDVKEENNNENDKGVNFNTDNISDNKQQDIDNISTKNNVLDTNNQSTIVNQSNLKDEEDGNCEIVNNQNNAYCEDDDENKLSHKVEIFEKQEFPKNSISEYINSNIIFVAESEYVENKNKILDEVLRGNCLLMINDGAECISCSMVKYQDRTITEPPTSIVINGPRAGFVENINTNITLIRRRLCNSDLKIEESNIGRYTKTRIAVCYIKSIVDDTIVEMVKKKLEAIDIDGIIDSEYLVDFLSKKAYSIFKQVGKSEKPDVAVAKMLEGRVIILVDGSPISLSVPFLFFEDLQASDDYYQKNYKVVFLRYLRLIGIFMSILLPGMYVALQSYHYKLLPTKFLVTILNSTQGLPLTPFLEVLFVILLFEILYESSIRMPKYMGMALSIVGALILGDTAVKAGLVSSPSVMIIALSGITIYIIPEEAGQLSLLRLFFVLVGGTLGFFGITMGVLVLTIYACSIDSYGVPYFAPFAPRVETDLKDIFSKATLSQMQERPESIKTKNKIRMKNVNNKH